MNSSSLLLLPPFQLFLLLVLVSSYLHSFQSWKFSSFNSAKLRQIISKTACITTTIIASTTINNHPVWASDINSGKALFELNCAFCHKNGGNSLPFAAEKTLKLDALKANNIATKDTIISIITNGKSAMPTYGPKSSNGNTAPGRLSADEIDRVAEYVLTQAKAGW